MLYLFTFFFLCLLSLFKLLAYIYLVCITYMHIQIVRANFSSYLRNSNSVIYIERKNKREHRFLH